jgi:hypothetical protein
MKKIILLLLLTPIGFFKMNPLAQKKKEIFTDSTFVIGKAIMKVMLVILLVLLTDGIDSITNEGEKFIISGAVECKSTYPIK